MIAIFNRLSVEEGAAGQVVERFASSGVRTGVPGLRLDGSLKLQRGGQGVGDRALAEQRCVSEFRVLLTTENWSGSRLRRSRGTSASRTTLSLSTRSGGARAAAASYRRHRRRCLVPRSSFLMLLPRSLPGTTTTPTKKTAARQASTSTARPESTLAETIAARATNQK
jgi:hypothetical protein